jgi:hypothetical protein
MDFTESDFKKRLFTCCVTKALLQKLREKVWAVSVDRITVQRYVACISKDVEIKFSEMFNKCVYYSLAFGESTDITSTAQMYTWRYVWF